MACGDWATHWGAIGVTRGMVRSWLRTVPVGRRRTRDAVADRRALGGRRSVVGARRIYEICGSASRGAGRPVCPTPPHGHARMHAGGVVDTDIKAAGATF